MNIVNIILGKLMIDYLGLEALHTIITMQSFQMAADKLHITQSAISQRLKNLEAYYGEPLLIRSQPYVPTKLGEYLLGHYKRVDHLESELVTKISNKQKTPMVSIAVSRDTLETWFMDILNKAAMLTDTRLEIFADDQELTINYLKKGFVNTCLTTHSQAISGCHSEFLGYMDYVLVASPEFQKKYFSNNQHKKNLLEAPAVIFDSNDQLHDKYLAKYFDIKAEHRNYHIIPSVAGFRNFALNSYAYALIPKVDIEKELKQKRLINLFPQKIWEMPVYWHGWSIASKSYKRFNELVIAQAKMRLRNK